MRDPIDRVIDVVCSYFRVTKAELIGKSRRQRIAKIRQIAMWLARNLSSSTLEEVGDRFGLRDHTTVLYSVGKVEKAMKADRHTEELVEMLRAEAAGDKGTDQPAHACPGDRWTDRRGIVRCLNQAGRDWVPVSGPNLHFACAVPHRGTTGPAQADRHAFQPMRDHEGEITCRQCGHERDYEAHVGAREGATA